MQTFKLIKNSTVLLNQPKLIDIFGRTGAQFISQLHYWIEKQSGIIHNGTRWVYNTEKEWGDQIRLSERQIRFYVKKFKDLGVLVVKKLHPKKSDRTNYFSLNYEKISELVDFPHPAESSSSSGGNCLVYNTKITNKDLNNKSEESTEDAIISQVVNQQVEQVRDLETNEFKKVDLENGVDQSHLFTTIHQSAKSTTVQDMISHWNQAFPNSKAKLAKDLSQNLMGAFIHRFEKNMEKWQHYCAKIASSSYLMGEAFVLNVSWALKFSTIDRILKNDFGVKDIQFVSSAQTLEQKALEHIDGVGESDACKKTRYLLLKKLGAATYVSWFKKVQFFETGEGRVIFKADNTFVEDYITQKFGNLLSKHF